MRPQHGAEVHEVFYETALHTFIWVVFSCLHIVTDPDKILRDDSVPTPSAFMTFQNKCRRIKRGTNNQKTENKQINAGKIEHHDQPVLFFFFSFYGFVAGCEKLRVCIAAYCLKKKKKTVQMSRIFTFFSPFWLFSDYCFSQNTEKRMKNSLFNKHQLSQQ